MILPLLLAAAAPTPTPSVDRSVTAARAVVADYYAAIDRRRYPVAYRAWDRGGAASGQSAAGFARGFARTAHVVARVGAARDEEGAAGSSYVTVPVDVRAVLTDGRRQHFTGSYVLRAVNDVPGSTPDERRWHLYSATLRAAN